MHMFVELALKFKVGIGLVVQLLNMETGSVFV